MKHLPWKLLGTAVLVGLIFDVLFFKTNNLGINVLLFELAFLGTSIGLSYHLKQKIETRTWVAAGFGTAYALTFAIWTSTIGLALSGIGLIAANLFYILFLLGHSDKFRHPFSVVSAHFKHTFFGVMKRISIIDHLKLPGLSRKGSSITRGLLIAAPIVAIFFILFVSSDQILEQNTENLFSSIEDFLSSGDFVSHGIIILIVSFISFLLFATAFWRRLEIQSLNELVPKFKIESAVILGSVTALFFGFLAFQGYYLFGGEAAWNNIEGITYSEYAVNGFFELAAVAILVLGLILSLRYFHTERTHKVVSNLEAILLIETILVVVSAWIRMDLYVDQYGFTTPRLFGFWFFLTIGIILVMLFFNIINRSSQIKFMRNTMMFVGVSMLVFTASAPDALSVQMNLNRATEEKPIDIFPHFNDLSAEAYPKMSMILNSNTYKIRDLITPTPPIEEYCTWFGYATDYSDPEITRDMSARNSITSWERRWNNFHYIKRRGGKGTPELKKQTWRTWNLSRAQVPFNEYDHGRDRTRNNPYTDAELKEACQK